jgi:RimJ/RimL family protein N-acetyltransferase
LLLQQLTESELRALLANAVVGAYQNAMGYPARNTNLACSVALKEISTNPLGMWLFVTIDTERAVGDLVFLGGVTSKGEYGVAYQVAASHQNRGLGKEAVTTLVDWAFAQAETKALQAQVEVDNVASKRILTAAGLRYTGRGLGIGELWRRDR